MYSLQGYETMVDDSVRMAAYAAAIRAVVSPKTVVVDLGAGTGVMSLLACQAGAQRVYAIEPDDAIVVARENAAANGMSERITFLQGMSTKIELPEKADVLVADLRGVLPLFPGNIESMIHAREHLLKPDGCLIPQRDRLWAALVTAPRAAASSTGWNRKDCGLSLSAADRYLVNSPRKHRHSREELLTTPVCWATLDYSKIASPHVENAFEVEVIRSGTVAGISMWFDTILGDDIGYSNAPGDQHAIYGMMFFPLTRAVEIQPGDSVSLAVRARHFEADYLWQWDTTIRSENSGQVLAAFQQSTFFERPLVSEHLGKSADKFLPTPNEDGRVARFILGLMDGLRDNGSIATALAREFPAQFSNEQLALTRVGQVCLQYC